MTHSERNSDLKERFPPSLIPDSVLKALSSWEKSEKNLAIACSGGVDSVFAIHWLVASYPHKTNQVCVLHFNHRTRGAENDVEESFVCELAQHYHLEFVRSEKPLAEQAEHESEEMLREYRLRFFKEAAIDHDLFAIVTAHHFQDKIETLLMRLSRGSGIEGLVAPTPISQRLSPTLLLRPLLNVSKSDIVDWMQRHGMPWCEDSSNRQPHYYRNYVRNDLIPAWERRCPQKLQLNIGSAWDALAEDAEALNIWTQSVVQSRLSMNQQFFPMDLFEDLPMAIRTRAFYLWLNRIEPKLEIPKRRVKALIEAQPDSIIPLADGIEGVLDGARNFSVLRRSATVNWQHLAYTVCEASQLHFPNGHSLKIATKRMDSSLFQYITSGACNQEAEAFVDLNTANKNPFLTVSFWQAGMRYQPLGMNQHKKLQDCFIDRKIPVSERHTRPVIMDSEDRILWVPGLPPSQNTLITECSNSVLQLTYSHT